MYDPHVCAAFKAEKLPYMIFLSNKAYVYKGPIDAKQINDNFLANEKFKDSLLTEDLDKWIGEN